MEMLFLTALLSLLWPDGIRKSLEAVKANTSKKKNREGGGEINRAFVMVGREEEEEEEE